MTVNQHLHRRLWLWLARNPGRHKNSWPEWKTPAHARHKAKAAKWNNCFACVAALTRDSKYDDWDRNCSLCPLDWGPAQDRARKVCVSGTFGQWHDATETLRLCTDMPCDRARVPALEARIKALAHGIADMKWVPKPKSKPVSKPDNERY